MSHNSQSELPMGDRGSIGAGFRPLWVNVYPLFIHSYIGEVIDEALGNFKPITLPDSLAYASL